MPTQTTRRLVLLPRFTTLVGANTWYTKPISVRAYGEMVLTAWRGPDRGTSPDVTIVAQGSRDLVNWFATATLEPDADDEDTENVEFDAEWMRLRIQLSGTDVSMTLWCAGEFVERER